MKMLIVCDYGAENGDKIIALANLIDELKEKGHDVKVVCPDKYLVGYAAYRNIATMHLTASMDKVMRANGVFDCKPEREILSEAIADAEMVYADLTSLLGKKAYRMAKAADKPVMGNLPTRALIGDPYFPFVRSVV